MAATRLIPLHENKGKTVAKCLKDRTDYVKNGEKTNEGEFISSYDGDLDKIGTIITMSVIKGEKIEKGCAKIIKIEKNPNKEKWILVLSPLEGKYQVQEMEFVLYNLEDNNTFIYINHKFNEMLPHEIMKELEVKKKYLFDLIKKELESEQK